MRTRIRCHSTGSRSSCHGLRNATSGEKRSLKSTSKPQYKDVVIVGNGPSAITLSYFLSGRWPYYAGNDQLQHPNEFLHYRLNSKAGVPLLAQDLKLLSEGLEGRSTNPVSLLFDALNHPDADTGQDFPSLLSWKHHPDHAIDHVVLGRGQPGGCWQEMDGNVLTISLGVWMELPELRYLEWEENLSNEDRTLLGTRSHKKHNRVSVAQVAHYYRDYVDLQGLRPHFRGSTTVTSVRCLDKTLGGQEKLWMVSGHEETAAGLEHFSYITPNVVLATGSFDLPNILSVPGENLPFVVKSLKAMEDLISSGRVNPDSDPVLIIGAGLSAADAIIAAHGHNIPIVHAFRRRADDPSLIFRQLPPNMYPEYHKVFQMMKDGKHSYAGYTSLQQHQVTQIQSGCKVYLQGPDSREISIKVSYVVVLIGARPNLSFLDNGGRPLIVDESKPISCRNNPLDVDPYTYESTKQSGLYAMGPLAADNFVRFVQGGALAITKHLHSKLCPLERIPDPKKMREMTSSASNWTPATCDYLRDSQIAE